MLQGKSGNLNKLSFSANRIIEFRLMIFYKLVGVSFFKAAFSMITFPI